MTDLVDMLVQARAQAADMAPIEEAQDLLMATRSVSATEAVAHLCVRAAHDHAELGDAARSVIAEVQARPPSGK